MQAFADQLSDEEIAAVATYVRNSWKNNTNDVVQPEAVRKIRLKQQVKPTMVKKAQVGGMQ